MSRRRTVETLGGDLGELIDRHDTGSDLSRFSRYADDPVAFIREVLGGEPWEGQVRIARSVADHPLTVVRSANAVGKDWLAARVAIWWVYARRGLALVTGPTERQVREVVMGEVTRAFRSTADLPGELFTAALRLGDAEAAGLLGFTSTEASRLTGFHAPRVLGILTEAQAVEAFAWEGLLACATGVEDRMLALGNPLAPSGRFYAASRSGAWHALRIQASDHPNLVEGKTVIPGGPSRAFVERIRQEYGEGSGIYQARVDGEFPDTADEGLFARSTLEEAVERWRDPDWCEAHVDRPPVVAVDPARYGPDASAVAVVRGKLAESVTVFEGRTSTTDVVEWVKEACAAAGVRPRPDRYGSVVVDVVGLGGGVADALSADGYRVHEYNASASAEDRERYMNRRAESYWKLRTALEEGKLALPPDEELAEELLALRWSPSPNGRIRIEAKVEAKGRLGRSPDRADAVAMALSVTEKRVGRYAYLGGRIVDLELGQIVKCRGRPPRGPDI